MNQQQTEILRARMAEVISERAVEELALGWLRYEALRKLNPRQYSDLSKENLTGRAFDDLVDEMITKPD